MTRYYPTTQSIICLDPVDIRIFSSVDSIKSNKKIIEELKTYTYTPPQTLDLTDIIITSGSVGRMMGRPTLGLTPVQQFANKIFKR